VDTQAFYVTVSFISFTLLGLFGVQAAWILMVEPPRETPA
jgi:hypothetical protein